MTPTEPLKPLELLREFLAARLTHCHLPGFEYVREGAGFEYSKKKLRQFCRADLLIRESIGIAELRKLDGAPFARLLYPSPDPAATTRDALLLAERLLAIESATSSCRATGFENLPPVDFLRDAIQDVLFFIGRPDHAEFMGAASNLRKATLAAFRECPDVVSADVAKRIETELRNGELARNAGDGDGLTQCIRRLMEWQDRLRLEVRYKTAPTVPLGTPSNDVTAPGGTAKAKGLNESQEAAMDHIAKSIPDFDGGSDDWISNKIAASKLGVKTKTLANHRSNGEKDASEKYGLHDNFCFWRRPPDSPRSHPYYFLPLMKKHAGQLAEFFPRHKIQ